MINEANDHPRYAVDVQRDQSKPGHPHATVTVLTYTVPKQKARGKRKKHGNSGPEDEKNTEKTGNDLKKRETGGILIDSDVVYPEYDVRKVLESGSSGTPLFLLFVDTN